MSWSNTPFTEEEIQLEPGESYYKAFYRVLNNFHLHFPDNVYRNNIEPLSWWDTKANNTPGRSERRLTKTHREFYDEIDAIVAELGFPMDEISKLALEPRGENQWEKLWNFLSPVYAELRKRGYSKRDLFS